MAVDDGGGTPVHFIKGSEITTIRMTDGGVEDCIRAAAVLQSRFFIRRDGWYMEGNCPIWGVYDTSQTIMQRARVWGARLAPRKEFICEGLDAPVMYAMALGGIE